MDRPGRDLRGAVPGHVDLGRGSLGLGVGPQRGAGERDAGPIRFVDAVALDDPDPGERVEGVVRGVGGGEDGGAIGEKLGEGRVVAPADDGVGVGVVGEELEVPLGFGARGAGEGVQDGGGGGGVVEADDEATGCGRG